MAEAVYVLCAIFSTACAVLLFRGFTASRARLLFWSGLCFAGLAVNNLLLFLDLVVVLQVDLALARSLTALASVAVLVYGLVWEAS
jgi:hypothetical protein